MGILGAAANWGISAANPALGSLVKAGRVAFGVFHDAQNVFSRIRGRNRSENNRQIRRNSYKESAVFKFPKVRGSTIFKIEKNEAVWKQNQKFLGRNSIQSIVSSLRSDCPIAVAYYLQRQVIGNIPKSPIHREYKASFSVVRKYNEISLWVNPSRMKISGLLPDRHVLYFEESEDAIKMTRYGNWLIKNSPFVMGMVAEYSGDLNVVIRRVTKKEVNATREKNLTITSDLLDVSRSGKRSDLRPVTTGNLDVMFHGMRLEYGYGFKFKPHWRPALRKLRDNQEAIVGSRVGMIFDSTKKYNPLSVPNIYKVPDYSFTRKIAKGIL